MLNKEIKNKILHVTNGQVLFNHSLASYTSFLVGGLADIIVFPKNNKEIFQISVIATEMEIPLTVIGGGSNVLIKDKGIRGIVMILSNQKNIFILTRKTNDLNIIKVFSGVKLQALCAFSIKNNLVGTNFALGIPGTVGGAIATNAGTSKKTISDILRSVTILDKNGETKKLKTNIKLNYKDWFQSKKFNIILECEIGLIKGQKKHIRQEARNYIIRRKETQPIFSANAGCFFKNPKVGLSAGELIDKSGLKGKQVGGAIVSKKHANFIINNNKATAYDILKLANLVHKSVLKSFKIDLELEVCILGD